mmetsp:Transcript_50043/g.109426  ORF Transcript_50043/g.109426 Transcript_50043/m.109426 type:complete len:218 (-) Transcript_50043:1796-2449(-)
MQPPALRHPATHPENSRPSSPPGDTQHVYAGLPGGWQRQFREVQRGIANVRRTWAQSISRASMSMKPTRLALGPASASPTMRALQACTMATPSSWRWIFSFTKPNTRIPISRLCSATEPSLSKSLSTTWVTTLRDTTVRLNISPSKTTRPMPLSFALLYATCFSSIDGQSWSSTAVGSGSFSNSVWKQSRRACLKEYRPFPRVFDGHCLVSSCRRSA